MGVELVSFQLIEAVPGEQWISSERTVLGQKAYLRNENGLEIPALEAANDSDGGSR